MPIYRELRNSLEVGFIDKGYGDDNLYLPKLITNDREKNKKVLSTIINELRTCDEFYFSVAFLTKSGVATLINTFEELETLGIKGKILVSQYQDFTQPEALKTLLKLSNIELRIATKGNFHAKGYFFKHSYQYTLIVGSSNLTASALCINKEWNLLVTTSNKSHLIEEVLEEANSEFKKGYPVTLDFIKKYEIVYNKQKEMRYRNEGEIEELIRIVSPNKMQGRALENIEKLRKEGAKKALLISATGTGKTYLSAFDVRNYNPKKFLFIVHRKNIAKTAMDSYKKIFKKEKSMGIFSGQEKDTVSDFIFSTVQTISKKENLELFSKNHFDYIVIDETHRASASTYQKILGYFTPKFLLGMTATPERTDGIDIFSQFDHNIAYEIRLQQALEEEMLVPFHYYGVTDIELEDNYIEKDDKDKLFKRLISDERVDRIIEKAELYKTDDGIIRGLIFCSRNDESQELSGLFNKKGYRTIALSGKNSEEEREVGIRRLELESDDREKLDYIFSVDIFNEGIDIPKINQIIMLRPTESGIVFVQQLGRGLRKIRKKEYLTVIDFIGNYENNYLIPIALYGDKSFDKSKIKKLLVNESETLPGSSTINFDKISKERIFKAIDNSKLQTKRDLKKDFEMLKYKLGRTPTMVDFVKHDSRNPKAYVSEYKSYRNFVEIVIPLCPTDINPFEKKVREEKEKKKKKLIEFFSLDIANGKRVEEIMLLLELIENRECSIEKLRKIIREKYNHEISDATINSLYKNLNFEFVTEKSNKKILTVREIYDFNIVKVEENRFIVEDEFIEFLEDEEFRFYLMDLLEYSILEYEKNYRVKDFYDGFVLYEKYSRKDILRILNWEKNEVAQGIAGYKVNEKQKNCPVFITYHGDEQIYDHGFLNRSEFKWMSKARRSLRSPDMKLIQNIELRFPLFVKKSDDEGIEFFYMGDMIPKEDGIKETKILDKKGKEVSVVGIECRLKPRVEDGVYRYMMNG